MRRTRALSGHELPVISERRNHCLCFIPITIKPWAFHSFVHPWRSIDPKYLCRRTDTRIIIQRSSWDDIELSIPTKVRNSGPTGRAKIHAEVLRFG